MSIFIRTVPNVMKHYNCSADAAMNFMDFREEGYSTHQAALMAGLTDPPETERVDATADPVDAIRRAGW